MIERMVSNVAMEDPPLDITNRELFQFPPPDNFPVCISKSGEVLARFEDDSWPMHEWLGKVYTFRFGREKSAAGPAWLTDFESRLLKLILVLIMWVLPEGIKPSTLQSRYGKIRKLFRFCASNGISVSEMYKYPHLLSRFIELVGPLGGQYAGFLRDVFDYQDALGFKILDLAQISEIFVAGQSRDSAQTPYIPSRINNVHLMRSLELMEDYNKHASSFEAFFQYIWGAYVVNNGPAFNWKGKLVSPFNKAAKGPGRVYYGSYKDAAAKYGVRDVLVKWMSRRPSGSSKLELVGLSSFFNAVSLVGATCLANLSAMRKEEINTLRVNCWEERITDKGKVNFICGETTKTINDEDARWIVCEDANKAVIAMASVARLRMKAAIELGVEHDEDEVDNPFLILKVYEPWAKDFKGDKSYATKIRKSISATNLHVQCPFLFSQEEILITQDDFQEALKVNPDLDVERFAVGKPWAFAFHQFRRTLMVNACLSEMVSPQSLQYQLKHLYLSMSIYYGRNYSGLAVNAKAAEEYISTSYELIARKAMALVEPKFVSTISPLHKERAIDFIEGATLKVLAKKFRGGERTVKETIMGVCLNTEPCEFGSVDFILACDKCVSGLACRDNLPLIKRVDARLKSQLDVVGEVGPRKDALMAQYDFTQRLINVILVDG